MDTKFKPGPTHPNFKHGRSGDGKSGGTAVYKAWTSMKQRCHNPDSRSYARYGGRGIQVCQAWRESFEPFRLEMEDSWLPGLTVERIDNDRGYEPGNCKWATPKEQAANRRNSIRVETPWGPMSLPDAAARAGISHPALWARYRKGLRGAALLAPPNPAKQRT